MKRALPWILIAIVAGGAIAGLYSLTRRDRVPPPIAELEGSPLFTATPSGAGALFTLHPSSDQPLRSVRFLPALEDGEVLAQVLTQTGDQLIAHFKEGQFKGTTRLPTPDGAPPAFFQFARLQDAASMDDGSLLLLYTDGTGGGGAPWLVNVDMATQAIRWARKASGAHIEMEPGNRSCLLWDGHTLARASWGKKPSLVAITLPPNISVLDAVESMPRGRILLAHPGGLAIQSGGAWTLTPLPEPAELAFPGAPGALAPSGKTVFWQPRPGQLSQIGSDGSITSLDLSKLSLPQGRERDSALLRLLGSDVRGRLWFILATPDFSVAPHPSVTQQPSAALQATAAMAGGTSVPDPNPATFDPSSWMDYMKGGLDRAYVWDPTTSSPQLIDWKAKWASLAPPPDFTLPLPRNVQPEGNALLLDLDTRAWWLPLDRLAR